VTSEKLQRYIIRETVSGQLTLSRALSFGRINKIQLVIFRQPLGCMKLPTECIITI